MGWTEFRDSPHLSRAEMIRKELSQAPTADNPRAWGFDYMTERGSVVYAVGWSDAPERDRIYFGLVCLTSRRNGYFAYKDMTEDMGPYQYDAPAKMLDMLDRLAPNPNSHAAAWRQACRERIAAKKKNRTAYAPEQRVQYGNKVYTLKSPAGPRRGWYVVQSDTMQQFRMTAHQLSHARKLEPHEMPAIFSKEVSPEQFIRDHFQIVHITR